MESKADISRRLSRRMLVRAFVIAMVFMLLSSCGPAVRAGTRAPAGTGSTIYFAEGYTGPGFEEYLCLFNPNTVAAAVNVRYYIGSNGTTVQNYYTVPATSRYTVNVNSAVGADKEVSMRVISDLQNIVAERPMYFNYMGLTGGSCVMGARGLSNQWYFAEGTTRSGFWEYLTIMNPGESAAQLNFRYMVEGEGLKVFTATAPAHSRTTFDVRKHIKDNKDASVQVLSDQPIVAERPMYFEYQSMDQHVWTGGHCVVGAMAPAPDWYFAEGYTGPGFDEWLCLQNPNTKDIKVNASYNFGPNKIAPVNRTYTVKALERRTVYVPKEAGYDRNVSVRLLTPDKADVFVAERPMYFDYHGCWTGGSDVLGATGRFANWYFAEGRTENDFDTWLTIWNPSSFFDAKVEVTWYPEGNAPVSLKLNVPAQSRATVNVNDYIHAMSVATKVTSDQPLVVERPMFFNFISTNGQEWNGGHDVVGYPLP